MNYFYLNTDPYQTGGVPQEKHFKGPYNALAPNALWKFAHDPTMKELWVPEAFELRHQARFTDICCFNLASFPYLIVSEKFHQILATFRLPEHQVFTTNLVKREKSIRYYIYISKITFPEYVDFERSEYFAYTKFNRKPPEKLEISINNLDDFNNANQLYSDPVSLKARFCLKNEVIQFDLFRLPPVVGRPFYIVSQNLKQAIEAAGLKGFLFEEFV